LTSGCLPKGGERLEERKLALKKITSALEFKRKIVGVKFLFTEEEFIQAEAKALKVKMPYCVMVRMAGNGYSLKSTLATSGCGGGTRALGLESPSDEFSSGREYYSFGLYQDLAVAKNVVKNITFCQHRIYGVLTKPLAEFKEDPDVVIIVTNPYNAMRIIQGYTYKFGTQTNFKLAANQAVCSECTAYPYESNDINISMFCSGTRYLAGWGKDEMAIGLPYGKFLATADGVYRTINGSERNEEKARIRASLRLNQLEDPGIHDYEAYFYPPSKTSKTPS